MSLVQAIAFGLIAAAMLGAGLMAVTTRNLVHSVLWLAVTLVSTAALYVGLSAPFLAAMQVLLYTGGVVTLMLFGVMLTDHRHGPEHAAGKSDGTQPAGVFSPSTRMVPGLLVATALFGVLAAALLKTNWPMPPAQIPGNTQALGAVLLGPHLVAFEALSVLLLAALLAAVVLARKRDA